MSLAPYLARRLVSCALILVVTSALLILLLHMIPGDPVSAALGPRATPVLRAQFAARTGFDRPFLDQVALFLGRAMRGDLGEDLWSGRKVTSMILEVLPNTLLLTINGLGWALLVGVPLGCLCALRPGSAFDRILGAGSVTLIAAPSFVIGVYALLLFSVKLRWFPAMGAGQPGDPGDIARHLVLPALTVGLGWTGYLARLVRGAMLEVMGETHILAARAFGLPQRRIVGRYALRLALVPPVGVLGIGFSSIVANSAFVEIIFNRPGVGRLAYDAVMTRNYPVVLGVVFVTTSLYLLSVLVADLLVLGLDPRADGV